MWKADSEFLVGEQTFHGEAIRSSASFRSIESEGIRQGRWSRGGGRSRGVSSGNATTVIFAVQHAPEFFQRVGDVLFGGAAFGLFQPGHLATVHRPGNGSAFLATADVR